MEVEMGSSKSIIVWDTLHKLLPTVPKSHLSACHTRLRDYQGNTIPIMGRAKILVERVISLVTSH